MTGANLIAKERARQIEEEGFTAELYREVNTMKKIFQIVLVGLVLAFSSFVAAAEPAESEDSRDSILRGYAAVLGRAGACGLNIEPQFMRVIMWTELRYRASANDAMENIFFPELEANTSIQNSGTAKEDCPMVQIIFEQTTWP